MIRCSLGFPVKVKNGMVDKILLGKNLRSFLDIGIGLWSGFGGKIEPGESMSDCLCRELCEECGIHPIGFLEIGTLKWTWVDKLIAHDVLVYLILDWTGNPVNSDEMLPRWFNVAEIPYNKMWQCSRFYFPALLRLKAFQGSFNYSRKFGNFVVDGNFKILNKE